MQEQLADQSLFSHRLLGALLLLVYCITVVAQSADIEQQLADQSAKRDQVRERIAGLQAAIRQAHGEHETITVQLAATEREIGELAQIMSELDQQLSVLSLDLKVLRHKQEQEQKLLVHEQGLLRRQLKSAYIMGRQERLRILLNQQDPALLSRIMAYYDYLNRARATRMQEIQRRIYKLADLKTDINSRETKFKQLKQNRMRDKFALEKAQVERRRIVSRLDHELTQSGTALEQLKQDEAQLNSLLKGIQQVLQDLDDPQQLPFLKLKGKLPWPASGRIKASFGSVKIGSLRWDGVIISAPEGRELSAVHAGRVAYADWFRGYGLLLIIDHGDGYMSLYGHNLSLFKETGDWVETGDVIGLVGSSGVQSAAGTYFGIRHDGKAVNPAHWCERGRGKQVG